MIKNIDKIYKAFIAEDVRLQKIADVDDNGNPFTICTNGAAWLKDNFFPNSEIKGYEHDKNSTAEIGAWTLGHDFLIVDGKYLVDFWYRHVQGMENAPIILDLEKQKDLVKRYYGDITKWTIVKA